MHQLTGFRRDLLHAIADIGPCKGLQVKDYLEDDTRYGTQINHGRLYPNLDTLVDKGFIEKEEMDGRSNSYELTDEGEETVQSWAEEWKPLA